MIIYNICSLHTIAAFTKKTSDGNTLHKSFMKQNEKDSFIYLFILKLFHIVSYYVFIRFHF